MKYRKYWHTFNEAKHERERNRGVRHYRRSFVTFYKRTDGQPYPKDTSRQDFPEKTAFGGHIETIVRKPLPEFSARFHIGNAGSETPFDGHLTILGSGLYWGLDAGPKGRKLAERITSGPGHEYDTRELKIGVHNGTLWVDLWRKDDLYHRYDREEWGRNWNINLNPLDHIFGSKHYTYRDIDKREIELDFLEGSYPVTVTLQIQDYKRRKSDRVIESKYVLDVEAPKGVPTHHDPSGGWKGDRSYGFGMDMPNGAQRRHDWWVDAKAALESRVLLDRARTGFREAQPEEVSNG